MLTKLDRYIYLRIYNIDVFTYKRDLETNEPII